MANAVKAGDEVFTMLRHRRIIQVTVTEVIPDVGMAWVNGGGGPFLAATKGLYATSQAAMRAYFGNHCPSCGNPDCPEVSEDPFWRRCPALVGEVQG